MKNEKLLKKAKELLSSKNDISENVEFYSRKSINRLNLNRTCMKLLLMSQQKIKR